MYATENLNPNQPHNSTLQTVKCECGHQILLLPDVAAMSLAIENHLLDHAKTKTNRQKSAKEVNRIADALIAQVLTKTSTPNSPNYLQSLHY